jgi:hypothetical protein
LPGESIQLYRARDHRVQSVEAPPHVAPDYSELQRVDISPREKFGDLTEIMVSADRTTLAYAVDHSIVCRRTEDFSIAWERPVEPHLKVWKLAISPDGNRVAVVAANTLFVEQQREYYIGVLDGKDGALLSKLPLNGDVGIDISPDGRLLAVNQRKKDAKPQRGQLFNCMTYHLAGQLQPCRTILFPPATATFRAFWRAVSRRMGSI